MSDVKDNIVIAGIGMATPVGLTAKDTYYAVRAGLARFQETEVVDKNLEPVVMATIPTDCLVWKPPGENERSPIGTDERIYSLYRLACEDLANELNETSIPHEPYPLYIGIPDLLFSKDKIQTLVQSYDGLNLDLDSIRVFSKGRASSLIALHEAATSIRNGDIKGAYIAGCDSYLDLRRLSDLDHAGRLKSSSNLDGFIPGEGAGIVFITTKENAKRNCCTIYSQLLGSSRGFENGHMGSNEPYKGDGLAHCVTELFDSVNIKNKVSTVYSSMNGEHYWTKEWGVTYLRNRKHINEDFNIIHPANCYGDLGAVSGIILALISICGCYHGFVNGICFLYASSDFGERCAACIE